MSLRARTLLAVAVGLLVATPAAAQDDWVPHQPPCKLSTGHYLVNGGMLHLQRAVESQFADIRASRVAQARAVLRQAILEKGQADNPAAWYYLGRADAMALDLVGADSAFRRAVALAPDCAQDVNGYRGNLAALALNDALRTWGAGPHDSAQAFFRIARSLDSTNAEIPAYASLMFASMQEPDSAARYLAYALVAAPGDSAHAARVRQAELEVARAYEARALADVPAARTAAQTRMIRDTTLRQIARDSSLLARITGDIANMRAGGGRLTPQARAAFERDSTLLETRLTTGRVVRDSLVVGAASDSAAAVAALAPAIAAYEGHLARDPGDADAALQVVRLYSATGDRARLDTVVARVAASPSVAVASLVQTGLSLYSDGLLAPAARLVEAALARNPNDHAGLNVATYVYRALGDTARLRDVAERRLALAPLDPAAARAMALAWDLAGIGDSARRWVAVADTGLGWNVQVTQFQATEHGSAVNGDVRNAGARALPAVDLVFEFLDGAGGVIGSTTVSIPALDPRGRAPLSARVEQGGAASWRYRRP